MPIYEVTSFRGGISDYQDKGISGAFKMGKNLDIRKVTDSLSATQALVDEGLLSASKSASLSVSPSASTSPSASPSRTASPSASTSPSASASRSESASSGISPSPSLTPSVSVSASPSVTSSSSVSKSPSPTSGLATIFDDLIIAFIKCKDGYTYGFGNTGSIYRRDADGGWIRVYKDPDGGIKGASEWYSNSGNTYLHFSTDLLHKRKLIPGRADWNDVETVGALTHADWHTQREAGGSLIIANGPFLALVGYDESFTNEALDLIPGNIAKTIVERNGRTITGTTPVYGGTKGINAAVDGEFPLAQVGDDGDLVFADMNSFIPIKRFPGGGKVNPYGVINQAQEVNFFEWEQTALSWIDKQSIGNMTLWGVYGADSGYGGIYSYGRKNKNHPVTLNLEYSLDVDEIGAIVNVEGTLLISYRDGSDFGVKAVDPNNKAEAVYEGLDFKAPVKKPSEITTWNIVELFMKPLPVNSWVEFWYKMNKTGDFVRAKTANGSDVFSITSGKKAVFRVGAQGEIFEPRIVLHPSGNTAPEVYRMRTYFE